METQIINITKIRNPILPHTDRERIPVPYNPNLTLWDYREIFVPNTGVNFIVSLNGRVIDEATLKYVVPNIGSDIVIYPEIEGGDNPLAIISTIALMVVAWYAAPYLATAFLAGEGMAVAGAAGWGAVAGTYAASLASMIMGGIMMVGGMLINAFLPPPAPELPTMDVQSFDKSQTYSWNPMTTQAQGLYIPKAYGVNKLYGNVIASHLDTNSNDNQKQYINVLIALGMGPFANIDNMRLNGQPLSSFYGVEVYTRLGLLRQTQIPNFDDTKVEFPLSLRIKCGVGRWAANTVYKLGDIVEEGTPTPHTYVVDSVKQISISSSTATSPIQITTATAHGYSNGDSVTIFNHSPNEDANGNWTVSNVTTYTFTLNGSTGVSAGGAAGYASPTIGSKSGATAPTWTYGKNDLVTDNQIVWKENSVTYTTEDDDFDALEVDVSFPNGLFYALPTGGLDGTEVEYSVYVRKLGDSDWICISNYILDDGSADEYTYGWTPVYLVKKAVPISGGVVTYDDTGYHSSEPQLTWEEQLEASKDRYGVYFDSVVKRYVTPESLGIDPSSLTEGAPYLDSSGNQVTVSGIPVIWTRQRLLLSSGALVTHRNARGNKRGVHKFTERYTGCASDKGKYEIKVIRITPDHSENIQYSDDSYVTSVREVYTNEFTYPRIAAVGIRGLASENISGGIDFSCVATCACVHVREDGTLNGSRVGTYTTGTVSATLGSDVLTGSGTTWTGDNARPGDIVQIKGDYKTYSVLKVNSDTSIQIYPAYETTSVSGRTYTIHQMIFEPSSNHAWCAIDEATQPVIGPVLTGLSVRAGNTAYSLNDVVKTPDGCQRFRCVKAGTTSNTYSPVWPQRIHATVNDGTVLWKEDSIVLRYDGIDPFQIDIPKFVELADHLDTFVSFGTTWSQRRYGGTQSYKDVAYGLSKYIVVGQNGAVATSTDGETWVNRDVTTTSPNFNAIAVNSSVFVAVGFNGLIQTTTDGITWTSKTSGTTQTLYDVIWVAGSINLFIVVGSNGTILTSPDGTTWTPRTSGTTNVITNLVCNSSNNSIVAIAPKFNASTGSSVVTSSNGTTWVTTELSPTNGYIHLTGITYDSTNSKFVALGQTSRVYNSSDGLAWSYCSQIIDHDDVNGSFVSIDYGNGAYVVVGDNGSIYSTSSITSTWTKRASCVATPINWVKYCNSLFVAVGDVGLILTSTDGITGAERRLTFNGTFDTEGDLWTRFCGILAEARSTPIWNGTKYSLAIDKATSHIQMFNVAEIEMNSFEETFLPMVDRISEIEVDFINAEKDYVRDKFTVINPNMESKSNKASLQLIGCKRPSEAYRHAKHKLNCNELLKRSVSVSLPSVAFASTIGDVNKLQHDVPRWGDSNHISVGGMVVSGTSNSVTLDQDFVIEAGNTYEIVIKFAADDTIEPVKIITNSAGTYRTLNISGSFSSSPSADDRYVIGLQNLSTKQFRILDISREREGRNNINYIEYNENVYNCDSDLPTVPEISSYSFLSTLPRITNLSADESVSVDLSTYEIDRTVNLRWNVGNEGLYNRAKVYVSTLDWIVQAGSPQSQTLTTSSEEYLGETSNNFFTARGAFLKRNGSYRFFVAAVNSSGVETPKNLRQFVDTTLASVPQIQTAWADVRISGLQILNQANDSNFIGKDVCFTWNNTITVNTLGESDISLNNWLAYYEVTILNSDGVTTRRVEKCNVNEYVYTLNNNIIDSAILKGLNVSATISLLEPPVGSFYVEVRAVDVWGDKSTRAARMLVTNTVPSDVGTITVVAIEDGVTFSWDPITDTDVKGYQICTKIGSGGTYSDWSTIFKSTFTRTLTPTELGAQGKGNSVVYIKVRSIDVFGNTSTNETSTNGTCLNQKPYIVVATDSSQGQFTSLSDAVSAISSAGGGTILIKNGTYTLTDKITMPNIEGEIFGETKDGVIVKNNAGKEAFYFTDLTKSWKLSDFTIDSQNSGTLSSMIRVEGSSAASNSAKYTFENLKIDLAVTTDYREIGILAHKCSGQIDISKCNINDGYEAIRFAAIAKTLATKNIIVKPASCGIIYDYIGGGADTAVGECIISENIIKDIISFGIYVLAPYATIQATFNIVSNTITSVSDSTAITTICGIDVSQGGNVNISENFVSINCLDSNFACKGISCSADTTACLGNTVNIDITSSNATCHGISVTSSGCRILNNIITLDNSDTTNNHYSMYVSSGDRNIITGNNINAVNNNAKDIGIYLLNSSNNQGTDNITYNVGTSISTSGGSGNSVSAKDV